jgi:hypothetical protein
MALVIASPAVFYILETMWTVAFRVLGLILAVIMFRRTGAPESHGRLEAKRFELLRSRYSYW